MLVQPRHLTGWDDQRRDRRPDDRGPPNGVAGSQPFEVVAGNLLERSGLVRLASRPSDARVTDVAITSAGIDAVGRVREVAARMYQRAFGDFSARDLETLNQLLGRILHNLSRGP